MVEYKYDAWGKIIGRTGSLASTLGYLNPFRYRGYVYDEETGLYYLRSRYYNPEWGRFINADVLLGKRGALLSHNLFAYCGNNSICYCDQDGYGYDPIGNNYKGWFYMIHHDHGKPDGNGGFIPHVHMKYERASGNTEFYAMNADGSVHDQKPLVADNPKALEALLNGKKTKNKWPPNKTGGGNNGGGGKNFSEKAKDPSDSRRYRLIGAATNGNSFSTGLPIPSINGSIDVNYVIASTEPAISGVMLSEEEVVMFGGIFLETCFGY